MVKKLLTKVKKAVKENNEREARFVLLEELFSDFHRNRVEVYKINFIRGIFFGLGSVLGGTVLITLLAWILSFFVALPWVGQPIEKAQESINSRQR